MARGQCGEGARDPAIEVINAILAPSGISDTGLECQRNVGVLFRWLNGNRDCVCLYVSVYLCVCVYVSSTL